MGILSGALAGLGEGVGAASRLYGEYLSRSVLKEEEAAIQAKRDETLRKYRNEDTVAADERGITNIPRVQNAETPGLVKRAGLLSEVRVKEHEDIAAVNTRAEIERFKKLAPLQRQEAIDTEVAKVNALATPEMLKKARAIAQAKHIVDPSYTLIPNADGTVTTFDTHSGKSTGTLKDAEGKPVIRKDSEEMRAAVSVINLVNTNLKIAEAAYKVDSTSLEPGAKEKAAAAWKEAQSEAKRLAAPAYAVLYAKAKIPGVSEEKDTPSDRDIAGLKANPAAAAPLFDKKFGKGAAAAVLETKKPEPAEPTVKLPVGAPDPNDAKLAARRAEVKAARDKEIAEKRAKRLREQEADAALASGFSTLTR